MSDQSFVKRKMEPAVESLGDKIGLISAANEEPVVFGTPMRDFLVYTSAGLNSNVHLWASAPDRDYDVWITNYSDVPGNLREHADYYNESKGVKFPNFKKVVAEHRELLSQYKAIMVTDDDIVISAKKLNEMFKLLREQDLWVVAPAYSRLGKISHRTTDRKLTTRYRYTNFAEVTCPIIRTDKLLQFMDAYDAEVQCYGVDWWYMNFFGRDVKNRYVISDEHYCINPRDEWKPSRSREIDTASSGYEREALWQRKSRQLGISAIEPEIYREEKRGFWEILLSLPAYLAEQLYWFTFYSKPSKKMRHRIKLALGRA